MLNFGNQENFLVRIYFSIRSILIPHNSVNLDMKIGEWELIENIRTRRLDYSVQLNSPVAYKQCKNTEYQVNFQQKKKYKFSKNMFF